MSRRLLLASFLAFAALLAGRPPAFAQDSTAWTLERCLARAVSASPRLQASDGLHGPRRRSRRARIPRRPLAHARPRRQLQLSERSPGTAHSAVDSRLHAAADCLRRRQLLRLHRHRPRAPLCGRRACRTRPRRRLRLPRRAAGLCHRQPVVALRRAPRLLRRARRRRPAPRPPARDARRLERYVARAHPRPRNRRGLRGSSSCRPPRACGRPKAPSSQPRPTSAPPASPWAIWWPRRARKSFPPAISNSRCCCGPRVDAPSTLVPEVAAVDARIEQSGHLARASRGTLLPSLSGNAAWHYAKPGVDVIANDWMDYYTLGLTASWTLWDWQSRAQRVASLRATTRALESRREVVTRRARNPSGQRPRRLRKPPAPRATSSPSASTLEGRRQAMVEGRLQQRHGHRKRIPRRAGRPLRRRTRPDVRHRPPPPGRSRLLNASGK